MRGEGREEEVALRKLAAMDMPGDASTRKEEFLDALRQLDKQTRLQRIEDLQLKGSLADLEKAELRDLLSSRNR